jgi:hypothetical protein
VPVVLLWLGLLPDLVFAIVTFVLARRGVRRLSRKVVVDGEGVHWKDVDIPWEQADRLEFSPAFPVPHIAILEKDEERPRALPFITSGLYRALRERLNPLPPAVERKVLGDAWE